jgi:hypothetical protein
MPNWRSANIRWLALICSAVSRRSARVERRRGMIDRVVVHSAVIRMRNSSACIALVACTLGVHTSSAEATFRRAAIDSTGQLTMTLANDRVLRPPKDSNQVSVDQVALSADRRLIGWVALYPNCCTSYPIPLELVILRTDGSRTVITTTLPIWQWAFTSDGRNVVIRQAPAHGAVRTSYELRAIGTGQLIAHAETDSAQRGSLPAWIRIAVCDFGYRVCRRSWRQSVPPAGRRISRSCRPWRRCGRSVSGAAADWVGMPCLVPRPLSRSVVAEGREIPWPALQSGAFDPRRAGLHLSAGRHVRAARQA